MEVPVRAGVEVPDVLDSCGTGSLGTVVVIWKETSPDSVAIGLAEYFALSISIVSYLLSTPVFYEEVLLAEPISEGDQGILCVTNKLALCLSSMILLSFCIT